MTLIIFPCLTRVCMLKAMRVSYKLSLNRALSLLIPGKLAADKSQLQIIFIHTFLFPYLFVCCCCCCFLSGYQ